MGDFHRAFCKTLESSLLHPWMLRDQWHVKDGPWAPPTMAQLERSSSAAAVAEYSTAASTPPKVSMAEAGETRELTPVPKGLRGPAPLPSPLSLPAATLGSGAGVQLVPSQEISPAVESRAGLEAKNNRLSTLRT